MNTNIPAGEAAGNRNAIEEQMVYRKPNCIGSIPSVAPIGKQAANITTATTMFAMKLVSRMVITIDRMMNNHAGLPAKIGPKKEPTNAEIPVFALPNSAIKVKIAKEHHTMFHGIPFFIKSPTLKISLPSILIRDQITNRIIQIPELPIAFRAACTGLPAGSTFGANTRTINAIRNMKDTWSIPMRTRGL